MSACVGAIILRRSNALLGLRASHKSLANRWDMFGGHIEPGETEVEALSRELEEELGVRPTQFSRLSQFSVDEMGRAIALSVYAIDEWTGGEPEMRGDEHREIAWFKLAEAVRLPNLSDEGLRTILRTLEDKDE